MTTVDLDVPGRLRDLPPGSAFYDAWQGILDARIARRTPLSGPGFSVDPRKIGLDIEQRRTKTWTGFPRPLLVKHRDDRRAAFAEGEVRAKQIEYLEWHVTRVNGKITRIVFCTETPEYWLGIAQFSPTTILEMYQKFVHPDATMDGLFPGGGQYNPMNEWNTTAGIAHYIMPINSLKDLLGVSEERPRPITALDNYDALPYGRDTGADARLSFDNWAMTRTGVSVGTDDPPGLYMIDWDDTGWTKPDGSPVGDYWTVVRGEPGAALRLDYEVPAAEGFVVGDIAIGGRRIEFGGQVAEHVVVSAHTLAGRETP